MKNEDQWKKRENEINRAEREKLQKIERERDFLKDRSIAGENAPRPTDEFIDRSLGQPLNSRQIAERAGEATEEKIARERQAEERRERDALEKMREPEKAERKLSEQKKRIEFKRGGDQPRQGEKTERKLSEQVRATKQERKGGRKR